MPLPKKIGVLLWYPRTRTYRFYCLNCAKRCRERGLWDPNPKTWSIRQGDLSGSFQQLCRRCQEVDLNPDSSSTMPELFPTWADSQVRGVPAPRTIDRMAKSRSNENPS